MTRRAWEQKYVEQRAANLGLPKRAAHLGEPRAPKEVHEQILLASYLDRIGVLWCHVPNGGFRDNSHKTASMFVPQGVKRGVPDNLIFTAPPSWPPQGHDGTRGLPLLWTVAVVRPVGVAIELKRRGATPSRVSVEQKAWGEELAKRGWYWFVARGAAEAIDECIRLGYSKF